MASRIRRFGGVVAVFGACALIAVSGCSSSSSTPPKDKMKDDKMMGKDDKMMGKDEKMMGKDEKMMGTGK